MNKEQLAALLPTDTLEPRSYPVGTVPNELLPPSIDLDNLWSPLQILAPGRPHPDAWIRPDLGDNPATIGEPSPARSLRRADLRLMYRPIPGAPAEDDPEVAAMEVAADASLAEAEAALTAAREMRAMWPPTPAIAAAPAAEATAAAPAAVEKSEEYFFQGEQQLPATAIGIVSMNATMEANAHPAAPEQTPDAPTVVADDGHTRAIRWKNKNGSDSWTLPERDPGAALASTHAEQQGYDNYVSVMADIEIPEQALAAFSGKEAMSAADFTDRMTELNSERASLEKALGEGAIDPENLGAVKARVTLLTHQESDLLAQRAGGHSNTSNSIETMKRVLVGLHNLPNK